MIKKFKKGDLIVTEGTHGDEAYLIKSGKVEIFRSIEHKKVVISILEAEQIFGEMSLIDEKPRSASAIALENTEVIALNHEKFNELMYTKPKALTVFTKNLIENLRIMNQKICNLTLTDNKQLNLAADTTLEVTAEGHLAGKGIILSGETPKADKALNGKDIEIKNFPFKIGRKTTNHSQDLFSCNDLYLVDSEPFSVSRNHLLIQFSGEKFSIIDRGSRLGSILNEIRFGGPVKNNEVELMRNTESRLIIGSSRSPYHFKVTVP